MPEKTVREMSLRERRRHSLTTKFMRAIIGSGVLLGIVTLIIGLALYGVSLTNRYVSHAFYLSQNAAPSVIYGADSFSLARQVLEIYRGLSKEERAQTGTDEYRERFAAVKEMPAYATLLRMLPSFSRSGEVSDVYLGMYDWENGALVYIIDPELEDHFEPGEWESVSQRELQKFRNWDGLGMLYDIEMTGKYGWMCTAGTPIRDKDGELLCFLLVDVTIENVLAGMRSYTLQITVALALTIVLLTWFLTRHTRRTLITPINKIAAAARDYVHDRQDGRRDADHFTGLNIHTGDEVENLSLAMADMECELNDFEDNLTRITAEKERIITELELASRIQMSMIPHNFPPFPDRTEFSVFASVDPARGVGGDFYDIFLIDDNHLCLVIADVSGKGIPAALYMMVSKVILQSCAMLGKSAAEILTKTNEGLCSGNHAEMFVTVWLGILEISTGKLIAANAGHEYPALKHADGRFEIFRDKHCFVVGGLGGVNYKEYELQLEPGTKLFIYTDGVPEASDCDGRMFGIERMIDALNEEPDAGPERLIKNVRRAVDDFVHGAEQFDDLTMLCLEYLG